MLRPPVLSHLLLNRVRRSGILTCRPNVKILHWVLFFLLFDNVWAGHEKVLLFFWNQRLILVLVILPPQQILGLLLHYLILHRIQWTGARRFVISNRLFMQNGQRKPLALLHILIRLVLSNLYLQPFRQRLAILFLPHMRALDWTELRWNVVRVVLNWLLLAHIDALEHSIVAHSRALAYSLRRHGVQLFLRCLKIQAVRRHFLGGLNLRQWAFPVEFLFSFLLFDEDFGEL